MRLFTAALISSVVLSAAASPHGSNDLRHAAPLVRDAHANRLAGHARDASTDMSKVGPENTEGEAHGALKAPSGSELNSVPVGTDGSRIQTYWSKNPDNAKATSAFIMIHGKIRNGDEYWTTMDDVLQSAIKANFKGVDDKAIVVAPQFFSTKLNSGQYTDNQLAWDDTNAWQAGDPANHPSGTKLTSFDALDALVDVFADTQTYPKMEKVIVVGHGGGGQLNQRYASIGRDAPPNVHVRYIHGDPSSAVYFTKDRPVTDTSVASKKDCPTYNDWRYGFDKFVGISSAGLKTPQEYFKQYITRDVVSIVGLDDTDPGGDQYCMAVLQGGVKRRDRNLSWYKYINMLAGTNEDLTGFPGNFSSLPDWSNVSQRVINTKLIVVEGAAHDATAVFGSDVGRAALFSAAQDLPTGWRPDGWQQRPAFTADEASSTLGSRTSTASVPGQSARPSSAHSSASARFSATSTLVAFVVVAVALVAMTSV